MRQLHRPRRRIQVSIYLALISTALAACGGGGGGGSSPSPAPPQPPAIGEKIGGFNFSPYLDGQDPNQGTQISENQLTTRMQLLVPLTGSVRSYSMTHGNEVVGRVAHTLGLDVTVGAFLSGDTVQNDRQKANLLTAVQAGWTDSTVIVGSEVLERGDLTEAALIAELQGMRQALPTTIRLGYADTVYQLLDHPSVVDQVDVVYANLYPYFDGVPIDQAMRHVDFMFTRLQAAVQPKPLIFSETGWPTAGPQRGGAVPSSSNAATFFRSFVGWAKAKSVEYFYFEAFDEAWKTGEGAQGPHWGVLDTSGNMKSGMNAAFSGTPVTDTWTRAIPGGAGTADLQLTTVPALGSFDDLRGQVRGVDPALYKVAAYIMVDGLWYPKPFYATPTTYPRIGGDWSVDVTTGSMDETATRIGVYLVPVALRVPPATAGSATIPGQIVASAVASREVTR